MQEKWAEISENLKKLLDPGTFKVWVAPLRVIVQKQGLCLLAQNSFAADWLQTRITEPLRQAAAPVLGVEPQALEICIELAANPATTTPTLETSAHSRTLKNTRQTRLPLASESAGKAKQVWRHSFEDFEIGHSNSVAAAAAKDICDGGIVQTLFVNSASGLGKTHLTQAVGHAISLSARNINLAYMTAEDFTRHCVSALQRRELESFRERLAELEILLLEDIHFLQGKKKIQEIALATLRALQAKGSKVIFTSSFFPRELQEMDASLASHFCSGILTSMERPSKDMRRRILERKARQFQVLLPDDVCELLAERLHGDVRQLESCLNSLVFKARLLNCGLNPQLALDMLAQYVGAECEPDLNSLIRLVCDIFGLTERQLASRSRRQDCVTGRNTVYYLARKHTDLSLEAIGATFNRRHSSVIKGITSVEREISRESVLGRQLSRAMNLIERNSGLSTTT